MKRFTLLMDKRPGIGFEYSVDWTDLAYTRLLAEPLFFEDRNGVIKSNIVQSVKRKGQLTWSLQLEPDARWSDGKTINAREIADQFRRVNNGIGPGLTTTSLIKSLEVSSPGTLNIVTRFPIMHITRILTNPAITPRRPNDHLGVGRFIEVERSSRNKGLIVRSSDGSCEINVLGEDQVRGSLSQQGIAPFAAAPLTEFSLKASARGQLQKPSILGTYFCLFCPLDISEDYLQLLRVATNSVADILPNLIKPRAGFVDSSKSYPDRLYLRKTGAGRATREPTEIVYSGQFPNELVVKAIAKTLSRHGLVARIRKSLYSEILSWRARSANNICLKILSTPWAHPAGILAPFYLASAPESEFRGVFESALGEESLDTVCVRCAQANVLLRREFPEIIPFGQVKSGMWANDIAVECPSTGWIDYLPLLQREV
jgi:hypothetical protein